MGAFQLIENKQFQKFCELYERKSHLRATTADYADLMPGNYMRALLGAKKIEQLIEFCQNEVKRREQIDRTTTDFYIGLSIGYFLQNNFDKAGKALIDGSKAKYQDIARTEVACIMYWESVSTHNDVLKRESKKIFVADGLFCREIDGLFCRSSPDIIVRRRCVLSHKRRGWLQPSPSFRYSRNLALQDELYHPVINNGPAVLVCVDKRLGTGPVNQSRDAG